MFYSKESCTVYLAVLVSKVTKFADYRPLCFVTRAKEIPHRPLKSVASQDISRLNEWNNGTPVLQLGWSRTTQSRPSAGYSHDLTAGGDTGATTSRGKCQVIHNINEMYRIGTLMHSATELSEICKWRLLLYCAIVSFNILQINMNLYNVST